MARELFPLISGAQTAASAAAALPMAREIAWNFEADKPLFRGGEPVQATGAEAMKVWAFNAIKTVRYRWEMFSFWYGCELARLVGQPFAADTKQAEAVRYIQEALLVSPYITRVDVSDLLLERSELRANVTIMTIYGEVALNV